MALIEKKIKYNGLITFWSLTDDSKRQVLEDGFTLLGMAELIPSPKNDTQALLRALNMVFKKSDTVIKTVRGTSGYKVFGRQDLPNNKHRYVEALRVTFDENGELVFETNDAETSVEFTGMHQWHIKAEFSQQKGLVAGGSLGTILSAACRSLGGIALRPRGGSYWIPTSQRGKWESIVEVVSLSCARNTVSCIGTTTDKSTMEAICTALIAQVESKLEQLDRDLDDDTLGKRALATREREAQELDSLVVDYEKILGRTLKSLRDRTEEVEARAAMAIFQKMEA
jgi:hypothetical protein